MRSNRSRNLSDEETNMLFRLSEERVTPKQIAQALKVTFLRKKTDDKDSKDGGMIFHCELASDDEVDEHDLGGDNRGGIKLVAKRISKGQTLSKVFSEKLIIMAFVKGLSEAKGRDILMGGGDIQITSALHLWM